MRGKGARFSYLDLGIDGFTKPATDYSPDKASSSSSQIYIGLRVAKASTQYRQNFNLGVGQQHGRQREMTSRYKVLIVDDHPLTQSGLRMLFSQHAEFEIVGGLERCATTPAFIQAHPVDIVLLDLNMPDVRGINILAEIVGSRDMTVIILTGESQYSEIDYALKLGARGVVDKADPPAEIIAACKAALAGDVYISTGMREGLSRFEQVPVCLSSRQMAILHYLAQGESNKEISYRMSIAQTTVAFHIEELRRRLDVASNQQIIERARALKLI